MKIKKIILKTSNIRDQRLFYGEILGLTILNHSEEEFSVHTPGTKIHFHLDDQFTPYHFAFTIPSNKILKALQWLKQRVEIQKNHDDEIIDFPAWNAESIYFYDADKNIVEFIARKNLSNDTSGDFESSDILEISEIGMATENFREKMDRLIAIPEIHKFNGGDEKFCAIGTERGLIILVDKNKKTWFPTGDQACSSDFSVILNNSNNKISIEFKDDIITYKTL